MVSYALTLSLQLMALLGDMEILGHGDWLTDIVQPSIGSCSLLLLQTVRSCYFKLLAQWMRVL